MSIATLSYCKRNYSPATGHFGSDEDIETTITYRELAISFIDKAHVTKMKKMTFLPFN